jgi:uncharacterized protein (DUF2141 family)
VNRMYLSTLIATVAIGSATLLCSAPALACERKAEISQVKVGGGPVMVAIYADEAAFMKQPVRAFRLDAQAATLTLPLCELPTGEIALMVFQDLNANGRMDFNPIGIPVEPFASSGTPVFGRPSWASAKVVAGAAPVKLVLSQ